MRRIEHVIFDLDGTLIDSSAGIEFSARAAVSRVLPTAVLPPLRPFIGPPVREVLRRALEEAAISCSRENLDALEAAFRISYDTVGWRLTTPCSGALDTLNDLVSRGVRCYVVTNKPSFSANAILHHLGMAPLLTDILCRDSRKPAFASKSAAVSHLIARHEILPPRSVLVGDSHDDAQAAAENAMAFIAATYGYGLHNPTHHSFTSLDDLSLLPDRIDRLQASLAAPPEAELRSTPDALLAQGTSA